MNGDLDALAGELETMGDEPPPLHVRALLARIDERGGMALMAVGRLTREVSNNNKSLQEVKLGLIELRTALKSKAPKSEVREMRVKLDSTSSEVEDTKQTRIDALQEAIKRVTAEKQDLENRMIDRKEYFFRYGITGLIAIVVTVVGWFILHVWPPANSGALPPPGIHMPSSAE